jgi:hypothetical protein
MQRQNIDRLCAEYGLRIAEEIFNAFEGEEKRKKSKTENHITKSLGVLKEDGIYAFFLYQKSRTSEKKGAESLWHTAANLLKEKEVGLFHKSVTDPLNAIRDKDTGLANNLDNLLLAKRILEQTLIYARYHAKALG